MTAARAPPRRRTRCHGRLGELALPPVSTAAKPEMREEEEDGGRASERAREANRQRVLRFSSGSKFTSSDSLISSL